MKLLPRSFYERDTVLVAQELLGMMFVRSIEGKVIRATIIETEAYRSDDQSCHAYRGKTQRNASLFGPVGHTYVYCCYGIHHCCNLVARDTSMAAGGVLIRGIMVDGRKIEGPGRVAQFLKMDRSHNNLDVTTMGSFLQVVEAVNQQRIRVTKRIGISKAQELPWRFILI